MFTLNVLEATFRVCDEKGGRGTYCLTSSGDKSRISLPCTTPALFTRTVGCPIYTSVGSAYTHEKDTTYLFNNLLRYSFDLLPLRYIALIISYVIYK